MLLALLALLPLAGLVFYNAQTQRRDAAVAAENAVLATAREYADNEARMVDAADHMLSMMAGIPAVRAVDAQGCSPLFARVLGNEPGFANLGLLDARGNLVATAKPLTVSTPPGQRAFFKEAIEGDKFEVSDFDLEPGGEPAEMMCGEPVLGDNGEVVGVMFVEMDLGWMSDPKSLSRLPPGVTLGVLDRNDIILTRIPEPEKWVGKSARDGPVGRLIAQGLTAGTIEGVGLDGVKRLIGFTPLDATRRLGGFVSAGIPEEIAFSAARRSEEWQLAMLAAVALIALAAAWFAADLLVLHGLRRLLKVTQKVAAGELQTRAGTVRGGVEFRELAASFDTMAASLEQQSRARDAAERELERRVEQRTAELAEANRRLQLEVAERSRSESKLRVFITNVPAIVFSIDRSGVITLAEGRGMEALKFIEGGVVGHSVAELYGDVPGLVESVNRALAGESLSITAELQRRFFEIAYSPLHAAEGTVDGGDRRGSRRHHAPRGRACPRDQRAPGPPHHRERERRLRRHGPRGGNRRLEPAGGAHLRLEPGGGHRALAGGNHHPRARCGERHLDGLVHYLHTGEGPVLNRRIEMPGAAPGGPRVPGRDDDQHHAHRGGCHIQRVHP